MQPVELIETNRYKIGISKSLTLNDYNPESRYLFITQCNNPLVLKSIIKREFKNRFRLIAGHDYFEANEDDILTIFTRLVLENLP